MNQIKPILHEINNADQLIYEVRELANEKKHLDHDKLVSIQKSISRAIELFRIAEDKVLEAITDDLDAMLKSVPDEPEEYNKAKESGDVDYGAAKEHSMRFQPRSEY